MLVLALIGAVVVAIVVAAQWWEMRGLLRRNGLPCLC
jgi:hypothetical protein